MEIHLLSSNGKEISVVSRPMQEDRREPVVACLPAANLYRYWIREAKETFKFKFELIKGKCWRFAKGRPKVKVPPGIIR